MAITKKDNSSDDEFVKKVSPIPISSTSTTIFRSNKRLRRTLRPSRFRNESIRLRRGEHELSIKLNKFKEHGDIKSRCEMGKFNYDKGDQYMLICSDSKSSPPFDFANNLTSFDLLYDNSDIESISSNSSMFLCQKSHFFDGSMINPLEEACLVLHEASENLVWQEGSKEEVVIWLLNSPKSKNDVDLQESSIMSNENSMFDNSTMSICSDDDFTSHNSDFDKTGSWFSSVMSKKLWDFEVGSSDISVYSFNGDKNDLLSCGLTSENISKTADFEDSDTDGPLFWPYERKFDWNADVKWDLICISPRKKGVRKIATSNGSCAPKSIRVSLNKRKEDLKDGSKKRLLTRSKSVISTELKGKPKARNAKLSRINTMPTSRLSKSSSTQDFMENKPLDIKDNNEIFGDFRGLLEESYFVSNDEFSIEKLVGLNEFDGHEGVDQEHGKDYHLILDKSLDDSSSKSRFSDKKRCGTPRQRKRAR